MGGHLPDGSRVADVSAELHAPTEWAADPDAARDELRWLWRRVADLTDALEAQVTENARLRGSVQELTELVRTLPQIVWVTRPDGWHIYFNQQWMDFTGLTLEESLGHGWNPPFHPEDRERAARQWAEALSTGEPYEIEYRLRRHDGVYHWMLGRAVPLRDEDGDIVRWFGTCTDIEDLKAAQAREAELLAELERRATHDPLTGLANRDLLFEQLELLLDQRHRTGIAVAFVDLDGFKLINDALGHLAGDRVLAEVGTRLRSAARQGDVAARIGGDEFVVVGEADDVAAAGEFARRMKAAIEGPVAVVGAEVSIRASVGHTFVPAGAPVHAGEALSRADHHMYAAKRATRR